MNFIGVSSLRSPQTCPSDQLPHGSAPVREGRAESHDKEEQIVTRGNGSLEGSVRFPRDPLLPISSDRSPASSGNHHRETVFPAVIAPVQELHAPAFDLRGRGEQLSDVTVPAESVLPSKAFSHPRP